MIGIGNREYGELGSCEQISENREVELGNREHSDHEFRSH